MPPKKDKKQEEKASKAGKGEGKDSKKKKAKVLPKGAGMGGTIGLAEKEVKKCMSVADSSSLGRSYCS